MLPFQFCDPPDMLFDTLLEIVSNSRKKLIKIGPMLHAKIYNFDNNLQVMTFPIIFYKE